MTPGADLQKLVHGRVWTALREMGFSRDGDVFCRQLPMLWHMVALQRSSSSTRQRVVLTVNLGVGLDRLSSTTGLGQRKRTIEDCHWRTRLGQLVQGQDIWWTVEDETSADAAGSVMVNWLKDRGVPALDAFQCEADVRDLWLSGASPGLTEVQRLVSMSRLVHAIGPDAERGAIVERLREIARVKPIPLVVAHLREIGEQL